MRNNKKNVPKRILNMSQVFYIYSISQARDVIKLRISNQIIFIKAWGLIYWGMYYYDGIEDLRLRKFLK